MLMRKHDIQKYAVILLLPWDGSNSTFKLDPLCYILNQHTIDKNNSNTISNIFAAMILILIFCMSL